MILDSSAIIAILTNEPGAEKVLDRVANTEEGAIGAPTLAETGIVLTAWFGITGRTLLSRFVHEAALAIIPFGEFHWPVALDAYRLYGKGRHPAALNYGDCLTYAVAKLADQPLLCVGEDFPQTDLKMELATPSAFRDAH